MRIPPIPRRAVPVLGAVLLALLPAVISGVLVHALYGEPLSRFHPYDTDEFNYWRQIATFVAHGWDGGYYTVAERTAPAAFTRFGVHGPAFPVLYGLIGKVVGWHVGSPPWFNLAALAVALGLFVWIGRPDGRRMGLAALVLAVFWPLHAWVVSNMQEPLHAALAIVLAAVFARVIAERERTPGGLVAFGLALLAVGALLRPTWGILFVPLLLGVAAPRGPRAGLLALAAGVVLMVGLGALFAWMAPPYPQFVSRFRETHALDPAAAWLSLGRVFLRDLGALLTFHLGNNREVLSAAQRVGLLAALGTSLVWAGRAALARLRGARPAAGDVAFHGFHLANLLGVVTVLAALGHAVALKEYRPLAPHLLLSLLVYVLARRWMVPVVQSAVFALVVVVFVDDFRLYHKPQFHDVFAFYGPESRRLFRDTIGARVVYDPKAGPWDNTLVVERRTYNQHLLAIDPGIGVTRVFDWDRVRFPLRSRYLLLGPGTAQELAGRARLRPVAVTPFGILYLNRDNAAVAAGRGP